MAVRWPSDIRITFLLLAMALLLGVSPAAVAQTSVCAACAAKARDAEAKQAVLKGLEDTLEKLGAQARAITTAILDSKDQKPTAQQSEDLSKLGQQERALEPEIKAARDAANAAGSPSAMPAAISLSASRATIHSTCIRRAPIEMRMPISRVLLWTL